MMRIKTFGMPFFVSGILLIACHQKKNELNINITRIDNGFGYQIVKNGRIFIDQPFIPALAGEQHFRDSLQALKTASLVVRKIEKNTFPRISLYELDSMKIDYGIHKFQ